MANTLSKTGIQSNNVIKPWHVTQSVDAFTGISAYDITLSGSLDITGPLNLDSPVTGNLITSASYAVTASFTFSSPSASNVSYALTSSDNTFFQLHHGPFSNPSPGAYYFALHPLSGSSTSLTTDSGKAGTYSPKTGITFTKFSITTTVEGTPATSEASSYTLFIGGASKSLGNLSHNNSYTSSIGDLGAGISVNNLDDRIYILWRTPTTWSTPPTIVSHNIVLYGTRGTSNI